MGEGGEDGGDRPRDARWERSGCAARQTLRLERAHNKPRVNYYKPAGAGK